jgi:hypothetical protein
MSACGYESATPIHRSISSHSSVPRHSVSSEEFGAIFTMSYDLVIYATPACISGDYPYFANVYELSTSVTSQQGIFMDARAPSVSGLPLTGYFVECELW